MREKRKGAQEGSINICPRGYRELPLDREEAPRPMEGYEGKSRKPHARMKCLILIGRVT